MLGDGSDDGDVDLGVAGVVEAVEAAAPGGNVAGVGEGDDAQEPAHEGDEDGHEEDVAELLAGQEGLDELEEGIGLAQPEHASNHAP